MGDVVEFVGGPLDGNRYGTSGGCSRVLTPVLSPGGALEEGEFSVLEYADSGRVTAEGLRVFVRTKTPPERVKVNPDGTVTVGSFSPDTPVTLTRTPPEGQS